MNTHTFKAAAAALVAAALVAIGTASPHAYASYASWASPSATVYVNPSNGDGLSDSAVISALQAAMKGGERLGTPVSAGSQCVRRSSDRVPSPAAGSGNVERTRRQHDFSRDGRRDGRRADDAGLGYADDGSRRTGRVLCRFGAIGRVPGTQSRSRHHEAGLEQPHHGQQPDA